jgi:hypothetical protein
MTLTMSRAGLADFVNTMNRRTNHMKEIVNSISNIDQCIRTLENTNPEDASLRHLYFIRDMQRGL